MISTYAESMGDSRRAAPMYSMEVGRGNWLRLEWVCSQAKHHKTGLVGLDYQNVGDHFLCLPLSNPLHIVPVLQESPLKQVTLATFIIGNYLDEIGMWFPRTHRILNHCLRRWRVCRHVRMTWGTICITPITTVSWVRWIAASITICWVVIPGSLARVIAIRWKSMCCVCCNESIECGVNSIYHVN